MAAHNIANRAGNPLIGEVSMNEVFEDIRSSQNLVDNVNIENEELYKNFEVTRSVCSSRLDLEDILKIQNTPLFKEAFGLMSDYWMFKVFQNNIFDNNKVNVIFKSLIIISCGRSSSRCYNLC